MVPTVHGMVLQCNIYGFAKYCKNCFHLEVPHTYLAKKSAIRNLDAGKGAVVSSSCYPTPTHFHFSVRFIYLTGVSVLHWLSIQNTLQFANSKGAHITYIVRTVISRLQKAIISPPSTLHLYRNKLKPYLLGVKYINESPRFFLFLSAVTTNFYFATNLLL